MQGQLIGQSLHIPQMHYAGLVFSGGVDSTGPYRYCSTLHSVFLNRPDVERTLQKSRNSNMQ